MDNPKQTKGSSVEDLRGRKPGEDVLNPYENVDIDELPDWWRDAVQEFSDKDLRAYRPAVFEDGAIKREVIDQLEEDHGVDIDIVGKNVREGDDWSIRVNRVECGSISYRRVPAGYTVYGMESKEFSEFIERVLQSQDEISTGE